MMGTIIRKEAGNNDIYHLPHSIEQRSPFHRSRRDHVKVGQARALTLANLNNSAADSHGHEVHGFFAFIFYQVSQSRKEVYL
ncbi:hypothetical protein [Paenibacillus chitinolyticus]|uniref:hypothetical protein n=1 Tax=Paenibacillus chitinolyticus TaxID=79263 RepID=UPI00295E8C54|nr:hypothetical protein [Paenibacillus chitinolyticus]